MACEMRLAQLAAGVQISEGVNCTASRVASLMIMVLVVNK